MYEKLRLIALTLILACGFALSIAADEAKKGATKNEEGFVPLFNGKDLSGWKVMGKEAGWSVKDGVIHSDAGKEGHWLRSEKEFGDYILKVEWKVSEGGNSGVFIRCTEKENPWVTGYEIQISNPKQDESHCTGSLYSYVPVKNRPDESAGKWHTFEIECRGPVITVKSDDVVCIDKFDQSKDEKTKNKPLKAFIGLQDAHAGAGNTIEYRNIRIKELPKAE
jgi:hypothetical protein